MAAVKIAAQLTKGATDAAKAKKWTEAAKQLRWPYWDWTDPVVLTDGFPLVIKSPTVPIVSAAGTTETVPNPLAFYKFPSPMDGEFKDVLVNVPYSNGVTQKSFFSQWTRTYRWPGETATPTDDYDKVDAYLKRLWVDVRAKVAHLFTYENETDPSKCWDEFSNTTVQSDPSKGASSVSKSLEAVHNSIHIIIGGAGHLGQNDFASFDPVFWLHHANNDRIYALWEYCYPNYWVGAGYNNKNTGKFTYFTQPTGGTFYQLDHSRVDQATDMLPFRKARDAYWTPQDVRSLENRPDVLPKYYSYPPVDGLDVTASATDAQRLKLRARMQAHFGLHATVVESSYRTLTHSSPFFANTILDTLHVPSGVNAISNYRHFLVSVTLNEHAFNDSYTFELVYRPSTEEAEVSTHVAVLSRPKSTRCAACHGRAAVGNTVRGMIHIPSSHVASLLDDFLIEDTTEDTEADVIKSAFSGKLIGRGGHVFATARAGQPVHEADRLDECITPTVKFFSAYGGLCGDEGPLSFFGWQDHREVFEGCWKKGA
ncbi:Di-copper centre-containing protein [Exidia glandulosa HHB12029]|uniref:tyrosinase n=1 Tax=Exidia glandulosa HHB12029 TaxID=1314781 RepID=A0A165J6H5_EXIGL|nr:Di-copper centre-containing protein [Exidia glandulosa HHB12029]